MAREIRIVETTNTGLPSAYAKKGFARQCLRVVECEPEQNGYKSEKGVKVLWESNHYDSRSRGPKSKYAAYRKEAEAIAERARKCLAAGLSADVLDEILADALAEMA